MPTKISWKTFLSLQRQKLAAEAMQNRTRGEGGDVANLEDDDDEEMWAKLLHRGRPTYPQIDLLQSTLKDFRESLQILVQTRQTCPMQ